MIRILSALVLLTVVIGTVWLLPAWGTLVLAVVTAALAFAEYVAIAAALGARIPTLVCGAAVVASTTLVGVSAPVSVALMTALVVIGAMAVGTAAPGPGVLRDVAAAVLPIVYIGLPLGAIAEIRALGGRESLLLLMLIIIVSDSAQYYTGRSLGRHALAPSISPKKTVEGAAGGVIFGTAATALGARWVFPGVPLAAVLLLGAVISALGIVGDLFESLLKRSAGLKDSSQLIPGHGGMLDRIDSWLFAAPAFYVFVAYAASL